VESWSTPIVWRDQVVLHRNSMIQAFSLDTGEPTWTLPAATSGASTPIADGDMIYVSTWNNLGEDDQRPSLPDFAGLLKLYDKDGDGGVSQAEFPAQLKYTARPELDSVPNSQNFVAFRNIDRNSDGVLQSTEWDAFRTRVTGMAQDHGLLAIRVEGAEAKIQWRVNSSIPEVPSPLLYQGRIFLIRNGGIATCLDAATGKVIYRSRVGAPGAYFASPIVAAGKIYLASSEGIITVLSAGKDQLEALAHNELGEEIVATPALAGKAIYVRTLRNLYAFAER
jgi:outer membrane protein assembly factor BamB